MLPVSAEQHRAALERRTPAAEMVRPGVLSLPLPLPDWAGMQSTLCTVFLGDDGGVTVVDPGWDAGDNRHRLRALLARHGCSVSDIRLVVASHLHVDHLGLAPWIQTESGAPMAIHPMDARALLEPPVEPSDDVQFDRWGVPPGERDDLKPAVRADFPEVDDDALRLVDDGEVLDAGGTSLTVVHTPGHTRGSICLVDSARELILTGDHVLPVVRPGLALGGDAHPDPIGDYLASLDRLEPYDGFEVLPAHEYRFRGLRERRTALAAHLRRRNAEVRDLLDRLPSPTVWSIAERVTWTGGWAAVRGFLRRSALAQVEHHVRHLGRDRELSRD
ncbi:MBL fold metallo-hydrolase [Microbacterium immunditiarum]|uniref:Glyoxylase-like metal-dependent hydrolase (Beta-lactamase superfamily II) n=1 Tax=Microbacterium immunditiarum TaxID=337480 RepID=A0A7Y9KII2_9MICO|nr:MBL fold metallo-hydrolase [Microbacterium immunditiarum]NYE18805.1 glyoxylase-like metal-dependent hydrolase (beta-lactamase superfamily II) [Microbacterium immunditiarum]